ncbi:MAG: cation diffusion facilitator family transporter [Corynebacterium provencense]|uniref:cation diffusion facilitator family transporter n=2 Tax=Corynebacterium TaxID=1716 RepID=UPI001030E44E|nr:cation diffusion facilitator family transporter [Corynebacterium provencense]
MGHGSQDHSRGSGHVDSHSHDHSHDHGYGHGHDHSRVRGKRLWVVITMTTVIFLAEVVGGIVSGSLALLADAGHMLSDAGGLIVAAFAMIIGSRPATRRSTWGFRRAEVLAAAVNAGAVCVIAVWIAVSAFRRMGEGVEVETGMMLVVAVVGLVANVISALILNGGQGESLNMRGAYLHVLADLLGSVAVIVAALVIAVTGWTWVDPAASLLIALLILPRSWALLRTAGRVLMEQVPVSVDATGLYDEVLDLPGVRHLHDLHIWSVDGETAVASVHVVTDEPADEEDRCGILDRVQEAFRDHGISHTTVQVEERGHEGHEDAVCG